MKVLIAVDVQKDFLPTGSLPVLEGNQVVPLINQMMNYVDLVVFTQDWHPPGHGSFASTQGREVGSVIELDGLEQILWPDHCVQETEGAEFASGLRVDRADRVFQKGVEHHIDSYSGFFDNGKRRSTGLGDYLKEKDVSQVYIAGLATDYCVRFTAIDSLHLGFPTSVVYDACRAVNKDREDERKSFEEIENQGGKILHSSQLT